MRRTLIAVGIVLAACCYFTAIRVFPGLSANAKSGLHGGGVLIANVADSRTAPVRTKSSQRPPSRPRATHEARQLRDFFLAPLEFDGLTLLESLAKLRTAYEDTCRESGETPLQLIFTLPPGNNPRLRLNPGSRTLESSVHMLAGMAKLSVRRFGREYRFTAPPDGRGKLMTEQFSVNSGMPLIPNDYNPFDSDSARPVVNTNAFLAGLELDPSTRITLLPDKLKIETSSAADYAAITSFKEAAEINSPTLHKVTAMILEIPAGAAWDHQDHFQLDDIQLQTLLREATQTPGMELKTAPSITAKPGEDSAIEIVHEFVARAGNPEDGFETYRVGLVVNLNLKPLGLGHQVVVDFSDTSGGVDPVTGVAVINTHAGITDQTFSRDATTIANVDTHPDGTRTVLLLTTTLIGPTGAPARAEQP